MKKPLMIIALLYLSTTVFAQEKDVRTLPDFAKVDVGQAIKLTLIPGNKTMAEVKVSGNIDLQDVETAVHGDWLRIEIKGSHRGSTRVTIELTYKTIKELEINSAASVVTRGPIRAEALEVSVTSAADADLEVEVNNLEVTVSSAADLTVTGKTNSQEVSVSSAGEYDGRDLACAITEVEVSSAGTARVRASKELEAEANSGGTIKYSGNPEKVYVSTNSGGDIDKVN